MAHTYLEALEAERAAAVARGVDPGAIDGEIERIKGKLAEPKPNPEALGSPSAGDELIGREPADPDERHAGRTDVRTAGGDSAGSARQSGRGKRGEDESKAESKS